MKGFIKKLFRNKLLRFLIVGGCSTLIDFAIYMLLSLWIQISAAKTISMLAASVFSYAVNKSFTFQDKNKTNAGYLLRFYIVFAANLLANVAVNYVCFGMTGDKIIAFVLATLAGMTVNYIGLKFFVFKQQNGPSAP